MAEQFPSLDNASNNTSSSTNGGPQSQQAATEEPDAEYIEELLLNIMIDEFEVNVDDESGFDVAAEIVRLRGQCAKGNFEEVDRLRDRWESRKGAKVVMEKGQDQDNDTDWDDTDGEEDDEDDDMTEVPALVAAAPKRERQEPEVDEDGFTTVTRKR